MFPPSDRAEVCSVNDEVDNICDPEQTRLTKVQPRHSSGRKRRRQSRRLLLGGFRRMDRVVVLVDGQECTAITLGRHKKGYLRMKLGPGQAVLEREVWRAPSKVKPYVEP